MKIPGALPPAARVLFCLVLGLSACQKACWIRDPVAASRKKLLHEDLVLLAINSPLLTCPKYAQGDSVPCVSAQPDSTWDPTLPDEGLFSLIFAENQYTYCKAALHDPFLVTTLAAVPDPTAEAITWFKRRNRSHSDLFLFPDEPAGDTASVGWSITSVTEQTLTLDQEDSLALAQLDGFQRKMITVFHFISAWGFCPETNRQGEYTVHGQYNPASRVITLYGTACRAGKIYGSSLRASALTHRYYFIGAHEMGHAIDHLAGTLANHTDKLQRQSEQRANVTGLIFTKAISLLISGRFNSYNQALRQHQVQSLLPCDAAFIQHLAKKWGRMDLFFAKRIDEAKKNLRTDLPVKLLRKDEWSSYGCIERL